MNASTRTLRPDSPALRNIYYRNLRQYREWLVREIASVDNELKEEFLNE